MKEQQSSTPEVVSAGHGSPGAKSAEPARPRSAQVAGAAGKSFAREADRAASEVLQRFGTRDHVGPIRGATTLVVGAADDPYERAADRTAAEVVGRLSRSRTASTTADSAAGSRAADDVVQRDLDDRATSWKGIDEQADKKRLAQAAEEYRASGGAGGTGGKFDQSLVSGGDEVERTDQRIAQQKRLVQGENDLDGLPPEFWTMYAATPAEAVAKFGLTRKQQATLKARAAGKVGGIDNMGAFLKPKGDAAKQQRDAAKDEIATPEDLFSKEEIAAHLGEFANGAHTFIDIGSSKKILGWIKNPNFHGWGPIKKDAGGAIEDRASNFVAPLDEANAANAKAHAADGIETLENDLGIPNKNWSNNNTPNGNTGKELMRWVIPRPKLTIDDETAGVLLKMATGKEVGADPDLWVAGGFTKGGAREATIDAIPREDLVTLLGAGEIKQKIERYPETGDDIPWGPGQAPVIGKKPAKADGGGSQQGLGPQQQKQAMMNRVDPTTKVHDQRGQTGSKNMSEENLADLAEVDADRSKRSMETTKADYLADKAAGREVVTPRAKKVEFANQLQWIMKYTEEVDATIAKLEKGEMTATAWNGAFAGLSAAQLACGLAAAALGITLIVITAGAATPIVAAGAAGIGSAALASGVGGAALGLGGGVAKAGRANAMGVKNEGLSHLSNPNSKKKAAAIETTKAGVVKGGIEGTKASVAAAGASAGAQAVVGASIGAAGGLVTSAMAAKSLGDAYHFNAKELYAASATEWEKVQKNLQDMRIALGAKKNTSMNPEFCAQVRARVRTTEDKVVGLTKLR